MIQEIDPTELKQRIDAGDELFIIDMRQGFEYQSGHIPTATHMFVEEIPWRIQEIPSDKEIVFQCWHGNTSMQASAFLIDKGWPADKVFSLSGGMAGWVQTHGMQALTRD